MKRAKKSTRIVGSGIDDTGQIVASRMESTRRLLDVAAQKDVHEAIRQGIEDVDHCRTRPAREVFRALRRKDRLKD